ncbi:MAG: hypothetical protein ACOWW1_02235 [archaeon]|nr:hypothetical protein [Candidatus Bathyarchaeum sp.]
MKQMEMMLSLVILVGLVSSSFFVCVEASLLWSRTYGGNDMDLCTSMVQTADGGFVLFGPSHSFGSATGWLLKTDGEGNVQWNKTVAGASSFVQTPDGGFVFVGTDASPIEGYIPVGYLPDGFWSFVWLAKTDAYGNMEWNQTYAEEVGYFNGVSVTETLDGGYALLGDSFSSIGDAENFLLIKTDSRGNKEWSRLYNYSQSERASGLMQTHDGGFVFVRTLYTYSNGFAGFVIVKTDSLGNMQWNQTDLNMKNIHSFVELSDGSLVFAGYSSLNNQGYDFCMTNLDSAGNVGWTQTYGLPSMIRFPSIIQTLDGGFAVASYIVRADNDLLSDFLLVKTDSYGKVQWNQTFTGDALLGYPSVIQTADGDYVLSGALGSWETGDYDFWLIKAQEPYMPSSSSWTPFIFGLVIVLTLVAITVYYAMKKRAQTS